MRPIKPLASLDDAVIILRSEILALTKLSNQFVINGLSIYGADLAKVLAEAQEADQCSIQQAGMNPTVASSDTLIIIEPYSNEDSNNNMMLHRNDYAAYRLHVIFYGDSSEEISHKLKSALLQIDEKVKLNALGVQISSISNIEAMNEFKNETLWQRRDMDIRFAFRREYTFE